MVCWIKSSRRIAPRRSSVAFSFFKKKDREPPAPPPVTIVEPDPDPQPEKKGFFNKLTRAISKTRMILSRRVLGLVGLGQKIDEDMLEKLEEAMIEADFGVETTGFLMGVVRGAWKGSTIETTDQILPF